MGKKSRRVRQQERRQEIVDQAEEDYEAGLVDFTTDEIAKHLEIPTPPGYEGIIHPEVVRPLLEWNRVLQTAKEAGHNDPTRTCISRLQMSRERIKMTFEKCEPGPQALMTQFEHLHLKMSRAAIDEAAKEKQLRVADEQVQEDPKHGVCRRGTGVSSAV